jgi:phage protein D
MDGVSVNNRRPVAHPVFKVKMNGTDVTAILTPFLLSVSYTDFLEGEADTLDIRLEDSDGRFRGEWFPAKGQTLELEFGYEGQPLRKPDVFEIDEIEGEGPPDVVVIRAISSGVNGLHRTMKSKAYENTTLAAIAQQVARRLKLTLVGKIEPIKINRVTQIYENDLTFMDRLAGEYGYSFSRKGTKMVFFKRAELRQCKPILVIDRTDLTRYHIRDKIMDIAKTGTAAYHDPKTKRLKHYKVQDTTRATSDYEVKVNVRAESEAQAKTKAKAALEKANEDATQLEITVFGNPKLVAGINFDLTGMGRFGGTYHVVRSRHDIERSGGYRTEVEAKRIPKELANGA